MPDVAVELKKIAVFVEGLTEQLFVTKLFEEVLTTEKLAVVNTKMTGGTSCPLNITILRTDPTDDNTEYYKSSASRSLSGIFPEFHLNYFKPIQGIS